MIEKIGHIKNPLTVISIFAAIAEISGTTVLPFIESENQSLYVWFLMVFPVFLVGIFFITLNFNHKVLYAPSDYKDESNFLKMFEKATPEEKEEKLRGEIEESQPIQEEEEIVSETKNEKPELSRGILQKQQEELKNNYELAEKLAVNKLSKDLQILFNHDVRFETPSHRKVIFDAFAIHKDTAHAIEVKYYKNTNVLPMTLDRVLLESELVAESLKGIIDSKEFVLHFFAVIDESDADLEKVRRRLTAYISRYDLNVKLYVTTLNDLKNEYQYNP